MTNFEETTVHLDKRGLESLDACLTWAVQMVDKEFADARMLKIEIEQISVSEWGQDGWSYRWDARVGGLIQAGDS